jgi:hypothetical protein
MFRVNDLILLLVIFLSVMAAILMPRIGALFQQFPLFGLILPLRVYSHWHQGEM